MIMVVGTTGDKPSHLVVGRWSKITRRSEAIVGIQLGSGLKASIRIERGFHRRRGM